MLGVVADDGVLPALDGWRTVAGMVHERVVRGVGYGGRPDERSLLKGTVRNMRVLQPPSMEVHLLARIQ